MSDPLSDILYLLKPRRAGSGAINFGGDWEVMFPASRGVRFYAVGQGECWIEIEAGKSPIHLTRDDCVVLASGRSFRIGSALTANPSPTADADLFLHDTISTLNGGGACVLIGGNFHLDDEHEYLISSALPPIVVMRGEAHRDALGSALKLLWRELEIPQPGGKLVIDHLNQMMLIYALRLFIYSGAERLTGWLAALTDKRLAKALTVIHTFPDRPWSLQSLAAEAGMSRTAFAEAFKAVVGSTPMAYLTKWRMVDGAYRLREFGMPVAQVALATGYSSGPAFSTAFRKAFNVTPRDYVQLQKADGGF